MTAQKWRLIEDGAGDALLNMRADEAIFKNIVGELISPTLRLYEWERPSVSVGRFQSIERTVRAENCERLGVPMVRRITGGRGILHGHDLTVSAAGYVETGTDVASMYAWLARGFIAAFGLLDIAAAMGACSLKRPPETQGDCFACVSQADVVSAKDGTKLLGAALHLRQNAFLMQASIPLCRENLPITPADVFIGQGSQADATLRGVEIPDLRRAVVAGFAAALNLTFSLSLQFPSGEICAEIDTPCAL